MCCTGHTLARQIGSFEELAYNERSMILLQGDDPGCPSYDGAFTGQHFYVAGYGTEHERMFFRRDRRAAIDYAKNLGIKVSLLINARSFCSDRIVGLMGS